MATRLRDRRSRLGSDRGGEAIVVVATRTMFDNVRELNVFHRLLLKRSPHAHPRSVFGKAP